MGFLEWWGESANPGKIGSIEVGEEHEPCRCVPLVWARFVFVVIGLPLLWYLAVPYVPLPTIQAAMLVVGATLIYVAVSYLVDPKPDEENLGWAGGLMDNPVRYSDDVNRFLLSVKILFGPGRFVAESVLDVFTLGGRKDEDPFDRPKTE